MIFFLKIIRKLAVLLQAFSGSSKIYWYRTLYPNRLRLPWSFRMGKGFEIVFDTSQSDIEIGLNVSARNFFYIRSGGNGKLKIGNNVFFNNFCSINCFSSIEIGDDNQFGESVKFYDVDHAYSKPDTLIAQQGYSKGVIKIGSNCWFGSNVIILKNVSIGDNVVIGANCIIRSSIPSNHIVVNTQELKLKKNNYGN